MNLKELKLAYTNRAIMIFESLAKKAYSIETITDQFIFFYSVILANNKDIALTFDEFIDLLDEEDNLQYLSNWLTNEIKIRSQFVDEKKKIQQL